MTAARLTLGLLLATVAIAATACGGGSDSVPSGAVAVVDGTQISKREVDELVDTREERLRGPEAGIPESGNTRVSELPAAIPRGSRAVRGVAASGQGAGHRGHRQGHRRGGEQVHQVGFQRRPCQSTRRRSRSSSGLRSSSAGSGSASAVLRTKIFEAVTKDVNVTDQELLDVLHRESVAVRLSGFARRAPHPHRREGQRRQH